jgi:Domain of Unknown Function (DUF1080)
VPSASFIEKGRLHEPLGALDGVGGRGPVRPRRDSGTLVHGVGDDGAAGGNWLESVECQMIEGGTGDIILVAGKNKPSIKCEVEKRETFSGKKSHLEPYYKPGGTLTEFKGGRINWYGRDVHWSDTLGFRGSADVERKLGEWNTLEVICDGATITNILNGTVVNKGVDCSHTRGKILFQPEGAEVFFRRIELQPLGGPKKTGQALLPDGSSSASHNRASPVFFGPLKK